MNTPEHSVSTGNVYADLGDEDADEMQLKAALARQIWYDMQDRGLTQQQVADLLGVDQPKVSAIVRGHLRGFSADRLRTFVTRMGHDVTVTVHRPSAGHAGRTIVRTDPEPMAASSPGANVARFD